MQSDRYFLHHDGECRGYQEGDENGWYADKGRYALNFNVYMVDGRSMSGNLLPNPWKADDEQVFYYRPASRLETRGFPQMKSECAAVCDSLSFCKGFQLIMRGCEYVKPGTPIRSSSSDPKRNCEYSSGGCYCWHSPSCYVVTDYKTYKNSEHADAAGLDMTWGVSKTFQTALGEMKAQTLCSGGQCQEVKIGGKKTRPYWRTGYFCFMKNPNAAALIETDDDDDDDFDLADDSETDASEFMRPTSDAETKMCINGTVLPPSMETVDGCF